MSLRWNIIIFYAWKFVQIFSGGGCRRDIKDTLKIMEVECWVRYFINDNFSFVCIGSQKWRLQMSYQKHCHSCHLIPSIETPEFTSNRLSHLRLNARQCGILVISAYAPTLKVEPTDKGLFYDQLKDVLRTSAEMTEPLCLETWMLRLVMTMRAGLSIWESLALERWTRTVNDYFNYASATTCKSWRLCSRGTLFRRYAGAIQDPFSGTNSTSFWSHKSMKWSSKH